MSPAPLTSSDREGADRYRHAWQAVMQLARQGQSWSGHERNCVFLNCPTPESASAAPVFANVSTVSGLDHIGDGRALAVTDWDGDGDLDLWFRDRTAPRLRLMVNHSAQRDPAASNNCLIKLEGTEANRDAIGARVTLTFTDKSIAARTLRAGDAYLSQSSKWLHFGCGQKQIATTQVTWPGGEREKFEGVEPGVRHRLRQGTGKAVAASTRNQAQIVYNNRTIEIPSPSPDPGAAQILLPARVPLPRLVLQQDAQTRPAEQDTSPTPKLLLFWSADCPNCAAQIAQYVSDGAPAGLHLINTDSAASAPQSADPFTAAQKKLADLGAADLPNSFALPETLERVAHFQRALFDNHIPFAVPFSILTDGNHNAVAIYRGEIPQGILESHIELTDASNQTLRNRAVPFPGRWFTNAITPSEMAEMIAKLFLEKLPADAASMFERAIALSKDPTEKSRFLTTAFNIHHKIARESAANRQPERSRLHFHQAIALNPEHAEIRCDYGALLANHQQFAEAEAQFRKALEIRPDYPLAQKNLDLLIALQKQ